MFYTMTVFAKLEEKGSQVNKHIRTDQEHWGLTDSQVSSTDPLGASVR